MSVQAPQTMSAPGALRFYMQALYPASSGYIAWGVDVLGVGTADTSSGGTQRTSTVTAWASKTNQNGPSNTWAQSFTQAVNWVSSSTGTAGSIPHGGPDDAARAGACATAIAQLIDTVRAALTAAGL